MSNPFSFLIREATQPRKPHHVHRPDGVTLTATTPLRKVEDILTGNMRTLRLTMSLCDNLLSRGMAASDVVYYGLATTATYCSRQVHIDISYTILTISQDRGVDREPLTLIRTIPQRPADYRVLQELEELAQYIKAGAISLEDAEKSLDDIIAMKPIYPSWVIHVAGGGVSAGVVMMYTTNSLALLITFVMGAFVSIVLKWLAKKAVPAFYSQAISGVVIVVVAALAALLAASKLPILNTVNPTLIVIGGIVMLVAGMMIVSAFQDAIDEYYLTATARLLKVLMMTGGIVVGVTMGLYVAAQLGADLLLSTPDRLAFSPIDYQYIGAGIVAAAFALQNRARLVGVACAGLIGFTSLYLSLFFASFHFSAIASTGLSAVIVGLISVLAYHITKIPTLVTMSAGILPLVPGLTLYSALIYIVQSAPGSPEFETGISQLFRAIIIAIALAAGVTAGGLIGRPARARLVRAVSLLPKPRLSWRK